jgi:hypothetical protein
MTKQNANGMRSTHWKKPSDNKFRSPSKHPFLRGCRPPGASGLSSVPVRDILAHLLTNNGRLTKKELTDNDTAFKKEWNAAGGESFKDIIVQIDDCTEMAETAGQPYTDSQIMNNAYTLVQNTGMYTRDLIEWKRQAEATRTWVAFKLFMVARQIEQLEHATTAQGAGFHAAANALLSEQYNNAAEALANLATATASDHSALASLTNTVQQQTSQIKTKDDIIANLKKQLSAAGGGKSTKKGPFIPNERTDNGSYCWSHGFLIHKDHTSCNCKKRSPGHKEEATRTNTMGGNMEGDPSKN